MWHLAGPTHVLEADEIVAQAFLLGALHAPHCLVTVAQGLTLVHFSPQLEPCLTHKNTLHTLYNP
jgi:hypothetical protein